MLRFVVHQRNFERADDVLHGRSSGEGVTLEGSQSGPTFADG